MLKQAQISSTQLSILIMGMILGSTIIIVPGSGALEDAWIAYILAWAGGILLFSCYYTLFKKFKDKTLVEIHRILLGKWIGNLISILYIWYFIHLAALVLRNFGDYIITVSLPETPLWFIILCCVLVTCYATRSGIETTARISEMIVPLIYVFQIVLFFILTPHFDLTNLRPVLFHGVRPIMSAAFSVLAFPFGETVVMLMLLPYANKSSNVKRVFIFSFLVAGLILLLGIIRDLSVIGATEITKTMFPPHYTIQHLTGLNLDPLIGVFFFMSGGTKICCCYLAASIGIAQLTGSKDHRPFVIPIGVILVGLSIWVYESAPEMLAWSKDIWPFYSIPFQIVIPLILLILSRFNGPFNNRKTQ